MSLATKLYSRVKCRKALSETSAKHNIKKPRLNLTTRCLLGWAENKKKFKYHLKTFVLIHKKKCFTGPSFFLYALNLSECTCFWFFKITNPRGVTKIFLSLNIDLWYSKGPHVSN